MYICQHVGSWKLYPVADLGHMLASILHIFNSWEQSFQRKGNLDKIVRLMGELARLRWLLGQAFHQSIADQSKCDLPAKTAWNSHTPLRILTSKTPPGYQQSTGPRLEPPGPGMGPPGPRLGPHGPMMVTTGPRPMFALSDNCLLLVWILSIIFTTYVVSYQNMAGEATTSAYQGPCNSVSLTNVPIVLSS